MRYVARALAWIGAAVGALALGLLLLEWVARLVVRY